MRRSTLQKLIDALVRPDLQDEADRESEEISEAANLLQVGEFQLLQLAYHDWHGRELPAAFVNRLFTTYMLRRQVPHWARHYARRVIAQYRRGAIDPDASHFHRYDSSYAGNTPKGVGHFAGAVAFLLAMLIGGLWISDRISNPAVMLPPYLDRNEQPNPRGLQGAPALPS